MGADDKPDRLSPEERKQYYRYVEGKWGKDEIPRTPEGWQAANAFWDTVKLQGDRFEEGMNVLFNLTDSGWQREVPHTYDPANNKGIRIDFRLESLLSPSGVPENNETKSGAFGTRHDLDQMRGYMDLLQQGEMVRLYTRAERDKEMSKQARALLVHLRKQYPHQFIHRPMNERVFQRVMQAGERALEKKRQQELRANLQRIAGRDTPARNVIEIAQRYSEVARHAGIEQLRFMAQELPQMAAAETAAEHALAADARKTLNLRFQAARALEQEQNRQITQHDTARHNAIAPIIGELARRDREIIHRETQQLAHELQQQLAAGRIDLDRARQQFHALAYSLGKTQELERRTEHETATRAVGAEPPAQQLKEAEAARQQRDEPLGRQLGSIGAVVENEAARRERAEMAQLALAVNQQRLIAQGMDPRTARLQAPLMSPPVLRTSDRGRDPRELVAELDKRNREATATPSQRRQAHVTELINRGVPREAAEAAAIARLTAHTADTRSHRDHEIQRAEADLLARGIPPAIARAAAEGRTTEPPEVTRARHAEALARERERGISRGR
ncbi:hypothetical protein [Nocardia carnea]|uniref:hypothetical protein n=1 Tax=Nocardia carnea TaxID=37328 RepID=UPI002453B692|nr:hypothetical protein [Nocardia carnea]